mgnify:CR=1 FL=1
MRRLVGILVRLGDLTDAAAAIVRATPGAVRRTLRVRRYRRLAILVGLAYLVVYLLAIGDIAISASGRYGRFASTPSVQFASDWMHKLFAERAPFLYEPIAAIHLIPQLAVLISVGNLLVGSALAGLLSLNVAVAADGIARGRACRRSAYGPLLSSLPGFLLGFGCCVPSFILLLGTNLTAAILPTFISVRSYLFPASAFLMVVMLAVSARRALTAKPATERSAMAERAVSGRRPSGNLAA